MLIAGNSLGLDKFRFQVFEACVVECKLPLQSPVRYPPAPLQEFYDLVQELIKSHTSIPLDIAVSTAHVGWEKRRGLSQRRWVIRLSRQFPLHLGVISARLPVDAVVMPGSVGGGTT